MACFLNEALRANRQTTRSACWKHCAGFGFPRRLPLPTLNHGMTRVIDLKISDDPNIAGMCSAREIIEEFRMRNHLADESWLLDMTGTGVPELAR
jgi:hypothetical protein